VVSLTGTVTQDDLETRRAERLRRYTQGDITFEEMMGRAADWILGVGPYEFLLHPPTGEWLVYDRVHDSWAPTGHRAGGGPLPRTFAAGVATLTCARCGNPRNGVDRFCRSCGVPFVGRSSRRRVARVVRLGLGLIGLTLAVLGVARILTEEPPPNPIAPAVPALAADTTLPAETTMVPTDPTTVAAQVPAATTAPTDPDTCTNEVVGYTVVYPAGWHSAGTADDGPCIFFDPDPIEVVDASEIPVDVMIYWIEVPLDEYLAAYDSDGIVVAESEPIPVSGQTGYRFLYTFSDSGFDPGLSAYEVIVEHGGGVLVVVTFEGFTSDFGSSRDRVDSMAASLRLWEHDVS